MYNNFSASIEISMARRKVKKLRVKTFWLIISIFFIVAAFIYYKDSIIQKSTLQGCCTLDYSGKFQYDEMVAIVGDEVIPIPKIADIGKRQVLGVANPEERWIEVDLSEQKLRAWDGSSLFLETPISTGLPWSPILPAR